MHKEAASSAQATDLWTQRPKQYIVVPKRVIALQLPKQAIWADITHKRGFSVCMYRYIW